MDHRTPCVLATKGQRKVRYRSSGNKSQVTVVGCVSATGQAIPPFVIFSGKSLNVEWTKGEVPGTTYGLSDNGWMDMDLFKMWFLDHFLKHAVSTRPLLLLLDGETIRLARENDVIVFTLVPHTTHEMQPLDKAVFGPLKVHWRDACHEFLQSNPSRVITKYVFSTLLNQAWMRTMQPLTIVNGFRSCGIYPFNPKEVLGHDLPNDSSVPVNASVVENHAATNEENSENRITVTGDEEATFQKWYEEKYDIFSNPKYVAWLKLHHPEVNLDSNDIASTNNLSLANEFSFIESLDPMDFENESRDKGMLLFM